MKKKICIVGLIICLIVIMILGMYITDRIRMKNNKPVIFNNWGYSYVPPINLPEEEIKSAILKFIVDRGDNEKHHENAKAFASMRVYLIEEKKSFKYFNIYAWVLEERYYLENNEIKLDGGSSIPYKFVVENIDGKFTVTNSIVPRDGSYYAEDMKSIFPSSVRKDMERIQTDGTIEKLKADIQKQKEEMYNSTMPYIPDRMNVVDENKIPATKKEYNVDLKNVTIEVDKNTITSTSISIIITNNNENEITYGEEYKIQKNINGKWEDLEYLPNTIWNAMAYKTKGNSQTTRKLNIEDTYGELDKGIYRIIKPIFMGNIYSNEFEVKY